MRTLILKLLLCPDLYLSKISQLTLIFQKGSLVRKNVHSTHVGVKTCVAQEKKNNLALSSKKEDAFLSTGSSSWKNPGKM